MQEIRKLDVGFVILHYNNIEDTHETIQSIKDKIDTDKYLLVVVDNASPNKSGNLLHDYYKNDPCVHVILNPQNSGFSAGNNVGIDYLTKNYDIDFLILSNNDINLYSEDLYRKLVALYSETAFAVAGPLIMTGGGRCDANPLSDIPYSRYDSLREIAYYKRILKYFDLGVFKIYKYYDYYMKKFVTGYRLKNPINMKSLKPGLYLRRRSNVVLHGCFMIFSKIYFEHFTGLDERTFMYSEENILYRLLCAKGLLMIYDPNIAIYHKEGASVNKVNKGSDEAVMFRYKTKIASHEAYVKLLDELNVD